MKWRKWPESKPAINNLYTVWCYMVDVGGEIIFKVENGFNPDHDPGEIFSNILWLDESDAAFEEVARERGWVKKDEIDMRTGQWM